MRLTLHTDFALRVLLYAGLKRETLSTIPELVRHFDISKGHLMKVVHRLGQKGYLQTIRGKNGGLRLACAPAEIGVGAVFAIWNRSSRARLPRRQGRLLSYRGVLRLARRPPRSDQRVSRYA